ncbi:MAG TPA: hypothetical protein VN946_04870 [Terriglobales bacterium]|nr:hypothetical protein [Terriglobales bacterium]
MASREIITGSGRPQIVPVVLAPPNYTRPLIVVTPLFFMWGFLTCLNDILVPHLKAIFDLSYAKVMLVQFAFFPRISCFPSLGHLLQRCDGAPSGSSHHGTRGVDWSRELWA